MINITIDSQVLSTFMACPRKMNYVFNRHLKPVGGPSQSILKGLLAHDGMHGYWKARIAGSSIEEASVAGLNHTKQKANEYPDLDPEEGLIVFKNLIEYYKHTASLNWIPLFTEQVFKFIVYEDPAGFRIILTGRIDLGVKTPQLAILPIDHKSESERWFYSVMSNQFKIYALACKTNLLGVQRFGFQKTLGPDKKFALELLSFDNDILDEFKNETLPYYARQLLICQETGYYPPNHSSCVTGHFKCQFSDAYHNGGICGVSREIREQKLGRYFIVGEEWNPENL